MTLPRDRSAASLLPSIRGIALGCDYNPEQWPSAVWREDVALMRQAGVDLVAINIFGWSSIEPRPGEYDFAALDEVIGLLHDAGIRLNLGTGTASPPPWLTTRHPEVLPRAADGTTRFPGGRQAWCPSSPVYRGHALALAEQVARRYGGHPALALWHVSNELGCHNALCYDEPSAVAFRHWLRQRYGSLDALNDAWGTAFWSQRYGDWDEVDPPRANLSVANPAQLLDFHRFSSAQLLEHYRAEAAVLRRYSAAPITTNLMVTAHIRNLDYWSWAPDLDIVANDHYLDHRLGDPVAELSFAADLTRGLAGGAPWMLMEQATGAVNWQPWNLAKEPGQMIRNSLTHVARGADSICFFQWRASAAGAEKYHSAMLPHAGTDTTTWREVLRLSEVLDRVGEVAGTRVHSDVALLFSWESWWSADGTARPSTEIRYLDQVHAAYTGLRELGVTCDVAAPDADLAGYRLVVVPCLHLVTDEQATALARYVDAGGHLLVTFYSGIVDEHDRIRLGGYPGAFRDLLGVVGEEFVPLLPGVDVTLDNGARARWWTERLRTTTATTVACYADGPLPGTPAVTRNDYGAGIAWYLATALAPDGLRDVLRAAVDGAGVVPHGPENDGSVEVVRRVGGNRSYLFVVNHGRREIRHAASGYELVTGTPVDGRLRVGPGEVRVVREESAR
ncbi:MULTISPECIES: beta-galactosidase [unclassified Solwaraspora]|uniref:beta-galactosidase n=1 Tax=unclassified Solwaraspora TaxID=2627926 RepID=UPI00248B3B40|nr:MULTISPECIES: beta-galactosidase [unclassified Solwaraspora]WBB99215.1 beta-galactosidase [Solwaraspora sp. WMMA2059]WBC22232.1 beta-galactosidase [Solwaraspora sp. WMMA2080]WJK35722.1 beta-galactosidase [Solwaraspora sp. WMMA2065]